MDKPRRYIIQGDIEYDVTFYCTFCEAEFADDEVENEDICPNCGTEHKLWACPAEKKEVPE